MTPEIVRRRIVEVITSWFADGPGTPYAPRVLTNVSLDLAVAQGAAYYGVVRRGEGIRIGGGTARSFYVGLETGDPEKPWLCVVPRDSQEGEEIAIAGHDFDLLMGQPVLFPLASSSVRPDDKPGELVHADPDSIRELPPLQSLMRVSRKAKAERAPVSLAARVTEVGTIELWCQSRTDLRRWRLQIQLRGPGRSAHPARQRDRRRVRRGRHRTVRARRRDRGDPDSIRRPAPLGNDHAQSDTDDTGPARLVKRLEEILDVPRDQWPPSALRTLWDPLLASAEKRLTTPRHESRWFNLAGFFLRPGRGYPLDDIRIKALWPIFHQGVKFIKDVQCWAEWWILWRRVAAGLRGRTTMKSTAACRRSCCRPKGPAPPGKPAGPSPSRTSWPRCGAAPPASSAWAATSRKHSATCWSKNWRTVHPPPTCTGAWAAWVRACRSMARQTRWWARRRSRALDGRAARTLLRRRPRDRRRDLRAGPAREGRQRPRP